MTETCITITGQGRVRGEIDVPGDKSISHRAALFAAMARGKSEVINYGPGADCRQTLACVNALGCSVTALGADRYQIISEGIAGWTEPGSVLDAGNSGTTARLLLGVLSGAELYAVITGDESLKARPMDRVIAPLVKMNAHIHGRGGGRFLPVSVIGRNLTGIEYEMPVASAQVKTAVLLAGLLARGTTIVREKARSRDHTERLLPAFGVEVKVSEQVHGVEIEVAGGQELKPQTVTVPGDMSSAAFWIVAGAILPDSEIVLKGVNLNPTRTGLIDCLCDMGADITVESEGSVGSEPVGTITARSSELVATEVSGERIVSMVDEIPILALAATQARGRTVIRDAAELRVKESDRISATARELRAMGADITECDDGFEISGPAKLTGAVVQAHHDHRMAMMLAIAGICGHGKTVIRGADAASVSYPGWWRDLQAASGCGGGDKR